MLFLVQWRGAAYADEPKPEKLSLVVAGGATLLHENGAAPICCGESDTWSVWGPNATAQVSYLMGRWRPSIDFAASSFQLPIKGSDVEFQSYLVTTTVERVTRRRNANLFVGFGAGIQAFRGEEKESWKASIDRGIHEVPITHPPTVETHVRFGIEGAINAVSVTGAVNGSLLFFGQRMLGLTLGIRFR